MMKQYDSYKDSGVEWIGKIPSHWRVCRFKDFASLQTDASDDDNKIGLENIEGKTGRFIETSTEFEGNGTAFHEGDIVYGKLRPYLQKVWLATFDGNAVGDFFVFRAKENCRNRLLFYIMISDGFTCMCNGATFGAKMPRVSSDFIRGMHFYLPPIIEQDAIINYLDSKCGKIDKAIATQEKRVELLKELKQNIITQAVTCGINPDTPLKDSEMDWIGEVPEHWNLMQLKNALVSMQDGTHGSFRRIESPYMLLSAKNVYEDGIHITNNESTISEADYQAIVSKGYPQKGDVVVCCVGTIGRCCIYEESMPLAFQRSVTFLRAKKTVNNKFILYLIRSSIIQVQLNTLAKTSAQSGIYMGDLSSIKIVLPPLSEQKEIVSYIETKTARLDKSIEKAEHQIELLQELKQSIITEVVTGKRKVC